MPILPGENGLVIDGPCTVEDALPLLEALQADPAAFVSLRGCTQLHSAPLQVLLAVRPGVRDLPEEPFLARWVAPLLAGEGG